MQKSIPSARFIQFLIDSKPGVGRHGENANDKSEKTMVNRIIDLCLGAPTDENYSIAYDFLESDWGGQLWDKYYDLFGEKSPDFEGPQNKLKFTRFKTEARATFVKWQNKKEFKGVKITQ